MDTEKANDEEQLFDLHFGCLTSLNRKFLSFLPVMELDEDIRALFETVLSTTMVSMFTVKYRRMVLNSGRET